MRLLAVRYICLATSLIMRDCCCCCWCCRYMLLCCSHAGQPAVFGHAVSRDEPSIQRLLHHNAAQTKSGRHAALSVSIGSVCAMIVPLLPLSCLCLSLSLPICLSRTISALLVSEDRRSRPWIHQRVSCQNELWWIGWSYSNSRVASSR